MLRVTRGSQRVLGRHLLGFPENLLVMLAFCRASERLVVCGVGSECTEDLAFAGMICRYMSAAAENFQEDVGILDDHIRIFADRMGHHVDVPGIIGASAEISAKCCNGGGRFRDPRRSMLCIDRTWAYSGIYTPSSCRRLHSGMWMFMCRRQHL